ncbi:MAG: hypothetical protein WDZ79_02865 [Candidatus Paceibacterota bacterium]
MIRRNKQSGFFPAHVQRTGVNTKGEGGFTLVEAIFYILLLVVLFSLIIQTLLTITGTFQKVERTATINKSAIFGIERIVRETRNADEVLAGSSVFADDSGVLALSGTDGSGGTVTKTFALDDGAVRLAIDGADQGRLTPSDVDVSKLRFYHILNSATSEAIRMEVTVTPTSGTTTDTTTFYNTAVVRGSYAQ